MSTMLGPAAAATMHPAHHIEQELERGRLREQDRLARNRAAEEDRLLRARMLELLQVALGDDGPVPELVYEIRTSSTGFWRGVKPQEWLLARAHGRDARATAQYDAAHRLHLLFRDPEPPADDAAPA